MLTNLIAKRKETGRTSAYVSDELWFTVKDTLSTKSINIKSTWARASERREHLNYRQTLASRITTMAIVFVRVVVAIGVR